MKTRKLTIIAVFLIAIISMAAANASAPELYNTREGMYTFYRITTLKESEFEFYFSIDTCSDMEEYVRINFPKNITTPTMGEILLSSTSGNCKIKMEGSIQPGENGKYLFFTIDEKDGLVASEVLRGNNIKVSILEKDGNVIELEPNQEGLNMIGAIHKEYYR